MYTHTYAYTLKHVYTTNTHTETQNAHISN